MLDYLLRQQLYLEGVKASFKYNYNLKLIEIEDELRLLFSKRDYDDLTLLSKSKLHDFLLKVQEVNSKVYNVFLNDIMKDIKEYTAITYDITNDIISKDFKDTGEVLKPEKENDIFGIFIYLKPSDRHKAIEKINENILNSPIPASGELYFPSLKNHINKANEDIKNEIRKGVVNRESNDTILKTLFGTRQENYKDGLKNKLNNRASTVISTTMQHVDSITTNSLISLFYKKFQWISVIDNVTSDICVYRNMRIYEYGKDPLPPAHFGCRSKTVPLTVGKAKGYEKFIFYDWLKTQNDDFLIDLFGKKRADKIKNSDFDKDFNYKPESLTLEDYSKKQNIITG